MTRMTLDEWKAHSRKLLDRLSAAMRQLPPWRKREVWALFWNVRRRRGQHFYVHGNWSEES
jgi:hypothetical protein